MDVGPAGRHAPPLWWRNPIVPWMADRLRDHDRVKAMIGVAVLHGLLGYALTSALGIQVPIRERDDLKLFALTPENPPIAREPVRPRSAREQKEGAAAPPNLKAVPTPVVAPPPEVRLAPPPPVIAAPVAGLGGDPSAGAAEVPGPGTGAAGKGRGQAGAAMARETAITRLHTGCAGGSRMRTIRARRARLASAKPSPCVSPSRRPDASPNAR